MDPRTQEYFDTIVKKEASSLTSEDIAFLRARKSYLKKYQLEEYKEVLEEKKKVEVPMEDKPKEDDKSQTFVKAKTVK